MADELDKGVAGPSEADEFSRDAGQVVSSPRRRWRAVALGSALTLGLAFGYVWLTREEIAGNVIEGALDDYGIAGTYRIESVGPRRQVLRDIVIGDPAHPDLTVERAIVTIVPGFGLPRIGSVQLVKPRLYGAWRDGRVSFGTLDKVIYDRKTEEPTQLPDMELILDDARGLVRTPHGDVGVKAEGKGNLQNGFSGIFAAIAPGLQVEGCHAIRLSLYGKISTALGRPRFQGPLRLPALRCGPAGAAVNGAAIALDVSGDRSLSAFEAKTGMRIGASSVGGEKMSGLSGEARFNWREGQLAGRYDLAATGLDGAFSAARLQSSGSFRARDGFASLEWQGDLDGREVAPGRSLAAAIGQWERTAEGTLFAALLARFSTALRRETAQSRLAADFTLRQRDGQSTLIVPSATLRGTSGAGLVNLSRVQVGLGGETPRMSGNFSTGGEGLPRLAGRMEQSAEGLAIFHLSMADYAAGRARIALPELLVVQRAGGAFGFAGRIEAGGEVPGGFVDGLELPLSGSWSSAAGLQMWRECVSVAFDRLTLASLALVNRSVSFCPSEPGAAIVRSNAAGTRIAARVPGLDLAGTLGDSPLRIRGGGVAIAPSGMVTLTDLDVALGPAESATRLALARLEMRPGTQTQGSFTGAQFGLYAVPLDVRDASGAWRFADGKLTLSGALLRVEDRQTDDRFQPLVARDAQLTLADNVIQAEALLRNPASDREVLRLDLRHDVASGAGAADLAVDALRFDDKLQPDMLSRLALGVVANASGTVSGKGRIAWNERGVTSSGEFGTQSLDFAAAFGPAKGVAGTIHFTDLIGLTTAPNQRITVRSINPGIEAFDGQIGYELINGEVLSLHDAHWPFLGGTLVMDPVAMRIGVAETRKYVLHLNGVEASQFIERMEMGNISATGTFDGTIPLVFDENGGRVDHGVLEARPPGGNLSYVGELTYKDLSAMANMAFDALRSLDYRQMRVELDGPLTGEIVTRVNFDGIRQGDSAKRNILTKQIAKLPIRFNVNIHAPFYRLITSLKSMYDPALVRDPRELGLLDRNGRPVPRPELRPQALLPKEVTTAESSVQRRESEKMR